MARSTSNSNQRGSSYERAKRRQFLMDKYGDGEKCLCTHCGVVLTVFSVTCDRIIPGILGGTYSRSNVRPSCLPCNSSHGGKMASLLKVTTKVPSSLWRGVSWDSARSKWIVSISVDRRSLYVGRFLVAIEAALAYNQAAIKYHGDKAVLNVFKD